MSQIHMVIVCHMATDQKPCTLLFTSSYSWDLKIFIPLQISYQVGCSIYSNNPKFITPIFSPWSPNIIYPHECPHYSSPFCWRKTILRWQTIPRRWLRHAFKSTWTTGARQLVVQEALDTTLWLALSYSVWFTPTTWGKTGINLAEKKTAGFSSKHGKGKHLYHIRSICSVEEMKLPNPVTCLGNVPYKWVSKKLGTTNSHALSSSLSKWPKLVPISDKAMSENIISVLFKEAKVFKSPFPGAEMMTFLAPASMCPAAWHGGLLPMFFFLQSHVLTPVVPSYISHISQSYSQS